MVESRMPPIDGSCSAKEVFALRALGDSMIPEFEHDTVIVVDPEAPVRDGSYVVAKIEDGDFALRKLRMYDGKFFLEALNELYETVEISGIEKIKGVVIQSGNRRKDIKKYT